MRSIAHRFEAYLKKTMSSEIGGENDIVEEDATRVRGMIRWTRTDASCLTQVVNPPVEEEVVNPPSLPSLKDVIDSMEMPLPCCKLATCRIVREWIFSWLDGIPNRPCLPPVFATCSKGCGSVFCLECLEPHESSCDMPETPRQFVKKPRVAPPSQEEGSTSESWCACNIAHPLAADPLSLLRPSCSSHCVLC